MVSRSYLIAAATTMAVCSENSVVCSADSEYDMSDGAVIEYPRFNWLEAGRVAGAPHPDLNEGLRAVAPFLRSQGIGSIITLFDKSLEPNPEDLGFQYLFVSTPNFQPPPNLLRIVTFIEAQVGQNRGVLVHCFAGIGRTGTVLAAWLLHRDAALSAVDAMSRVRKEYLPEYARPRFPEHPSQADALEQFAQARHEI